MEATENVLRAEVEQLQTALAERDSTASLATSVDQMQAEENSERMKDSTIRGESITNDDELRTLRVELVGSAWNCKLVN